MTIGTYDAAQRRCRAHRTNGESCSAFAIHGGTVCVVHGGKAPQVKAAAEERLKALVDPAITQLEWLMLKADMDSVKLAAVRDILDRAGYKPREKVDLNVQTVKSIAAEAWDAV